MRARTGCSGRRRARRCQRLLPAARNVWRGWGHGYNAQVVVAAQQIILAAAVTQDANDLRQLAPMLDLAHAVVEAVFGQMKDRQDAGRFSMRGLSACRGEWHLQAAVHNLRKLHRASARRAEKARKRTAARTEAVA